ncbi:MAG: acyl-CoA thioesterase-2 [Gammaproteobacteria bacterium]|jgi:acyl-CoA thioesterase-2
MEPSIDLRRLFSLEPHGPDTYIGESPPYPSGRIYGGLVVAQALWAATLTVRTEHPIHSLHAYFILGGDTREPVRYEVDRLRNGRSFSTRHVTARQSGGAILTLSCSFQVDEEGPGTQSSSMPADAASPTAENTVDDVGAERCDITLENREPRSMAWTRLAQLAGDDPRLHACGLTYLSDINPMTAIGASHPNGPISGQEWRDRYMSASLDHAMWFHRPMRCDEWLLLDMSGHGVIGNRGLATGLVFQTDGTHVATVAQEGLIREQLR